MIGGDLRGKVGQHRRWLTSYAGYVLVVSRTRDRTNAGSIIGRRFADKGRVVESWH